MQLDIVSIDEMVKVNNLPEVSSPFTYDKNNSPHVDGLYSTQIFGQLGSQQRMLQFAYINLKVPFFHPVVFHSLSQSYKFVIEIFRGNKDLRIDKHGGIDAVELGEGIGSGVQVFYDNWEKIKFSGGSRSRDDKIALIAKLKKDEVFWTKFLVCPAFYRDMNTSKSGQIVSIDEVTSMYSRLISMCSLIDQEVDIFSGFESKYQVQHLIYEIYLYFTKALAKKNGVIHKNLLGKSVDYPTRTVISGPRIEVERWDEQEIPFGFIGLPLHIVISMFYPIFKENFATNFFKQMGEKTIEIIDNITKETVIKKRMKDVSADFIDVLVKRYSRSTDNRLDIVNVYNEFDKPVKLAAFADMIGRPVTLTDILFITAMGVVKDKHTLSTRYPLEDQLVHCISNNTDCISLIDGKSFKVLSTNLS